MRFALGGTSARDTCPAPGQDRPQHWSTSEQPGPCPTLPDHCPGLGSLCPARSQNKGSPSMGQNAAKLHHQSCPPLSHVTVPSMEGHQKQSSESPHGDSVLSRGGSACTKPSPTPQAGPCPSPADVQAWHPPVMPQPPQCFLPLLPGHRNIVLGLQQARDPELWEGTPPRDSTEGKPCYSPCQPSLLGSMSLELQPELPSPRAPAIAHLVFGVWLCFVSVRGLHLHLAVHRANGGGLGTQRTMSVQHRALPTPRSQIQPLAKHPKPPRTGA